MTVTFNSSKYTELLAQYQPKLIRSEADNDRALEIIEELMNRPDRSPEEDELYELLIVLIEKFEQEFYQPIFYSNAVSMLQFLMEHQGFILTDLASTLASEQIVADILAGDRELSIAQVKKLSNLFKIDSGVFI